MISVMRKMVGHQHIQEISGEAINKLGLKLNLYGFTSNNLSNLFGKEVVRHINIDNREISYLRKQVLYKNPELRFLVDFFLLALGVSYKDIKMIIGNDVVADFLKAEMFFIKSDKIFSNIFITPMASKYFLNDGNLFNDIDGHVIQIVMEQPYLINTVKLFAKEVLKNKTGNILDLCSGSGVIGQSVQPNSWDCLGVDINPRALTYAKFNAELNACSAEYILQDIVKTKIKKSFDIIVANPPYNGRIGIRGENTFRDITLHAGESGNVMPDACVRVVQENLKNGGFFFMCGVMLFNNGVLATKGITELSKRGTVIVLHKAISNVRTWEGMRLLYSTQPNYERLPEGVFDQFLEKNTWFDGVGWCIVIFKNGGHPGIFNVYNQPSDATLLSGQAIDQCNLILAK